MYTCKCYHHVIDLCNVMVCLGCYIGKATELLPCSQGASARRQGAGSPMDFKG